MLGRLQKLGIALVHGQLSITFRDAQGVEHSRVWHSTVQNKAQLVPALDSLWKQLGSIKVENVYFVFASVQSSLLVIRHPLMNSKELRAYLGRKAVAEWKSATGHIWGFTPVARIGKGEPTSLLHLAPAEMVEALITWCRQRNLQPHMALSPTAAAFSLLQKQQEEGIHMVVVDAGESSIIAVGKKDGSPLLVRELARSWTNEESDSAERLAREVQRTILFARQQLGGNTQTVSLYGKGAQNLVKTMTDSTNLPVQAIEGLVNWSSLALQRNLESENLFPARVLGHLRRRRMSIFLIIISLVFALLSLATLLGMEIQHRHLEKQILKMRLPAQMAMLFEEKHRLQAQKQRVIHAQALHLAIERQTPPPIAAWIAGFAADALPDSLVWTKVSISLDTSNTSWKVSIEGTAPRHPLRGAQLLEKYQDLLSSERTDLRIHTPWRTQWIESLRAGGTWEAETFRRKFRIEGVLQ